MKRQASFKEGDLRLLRKQATEQGRDICEVLLEANHIKDGEEFTAGS